MSRPAISSIELNGNISLSECHPDSECRTVNWWLYDERAGMNIGMRAETRDTAFIEAIEYWAERATKAERAHSELAAKVNAFVGQFTEAEDE
jgi:hypothetical protein